MADSTEMADITEVALFDTTMENVTEDPFFYYDYASTTVNLEEEHGPYLAMSYIYIPILYFIMFFAGVTGNLLVLIVIGNRHRRSARLVDKFVLNLALADLIFVFTLPLWAVSAGKQDQWLFGNFLCKISSYIIAVNRFSNIFFLTCMSIDRYLAVVRLMDSHVLRRSKCMHLVCAVVWGVSLILGIPTLVYRGVDEFSCQDNLESSFFQAMILWTVFVTFVVPVLIIVLCYGSMLDKLRRYCIAAGTPNAELRRRHSIKIVFTIIITFLVSWLPFNVFKTIQVIAMIGDVQFEVNTLRALARGLIISSCLAFVNSCLNPVIYLILDRHFRQRTVAQFQICLRMGDMKQSSHSTFSNATPESVVSATSRGRLFSHTQNN